MGLVDNWQPSLLLIQLIFNQLLAVVMKCGRNDRNDRPHLRRATAPSSKVLCNGMNET